MKVVLSTPGTFHIFHLARQLNQRNALEAVFTGYPRFKLKDEKIPDTKIHSFPWLRTLYMAQGRFGLNNIWLDNQLNWLSSVTFESYIARNLPPCDIYLGIAATNLKAGKKAQRQGATYICDRASSHIRYQNDILREEFEKHGQSFPGIDPRSIAQEEAEYAQADRIMVPSSFVKRSFIEMGVPENKLCQVSYGVELSLFHPVAAPPADSFEVLFVGSASIRKGIPYLLSAFAKFEHPNKRLTLVGSTQPEAESIIKEYTAKGLNIVRTGHVAHAQLKDIMSRSHVMVLPSIEEGMAYVQAQAMACGCPVIGTNHTGADDLFTDGVEGFVVPIRNSDIITEKLQKLAGDPELRNRMSTAAIARVKQMGGWDSYGEKMFKLFSDLIEKKK